MTIPTTQKVVLFEKTGGPEVLQYTDFAVPTISGSQVLVKNKYAGVNFIETYFRTGIYPSKKPYVLGREASGTVVAVGKDVTKYKVGDRVAYAAGASFAQYTAVSENGVILPVPKEATEEQFQKFGSVIIQGLTAITFVHEAHEVKKGDYVLVYAAAGGVGQILVQLIKQIGAHSIAVASTDEKLQLAKSLGAEYLINSSTDNVVDKVLEITNNQGVEVAFDSVGKDTFEDTLKVVKRKGSFVSYGNSSGPVEGVKFSSFPRNIKVSRPSLFNFLVTEDEISRYVKILTDAIISNKLKFNISKTYPLKDYPEATIALESRKTTGKLSLEIPQ